MKTYTTFIPSAPNVNSFGMFCLSLQNSSMWQDSKVICKIRGNYISSTLIFSFYLDGIVLRILNLMSAAITRSGILLMSNVYVLQPDSSLHYGCRSVYVLVK